jgi:PAS domain-containing protein
MAASFRVSVISGPSPHARLARLVIGLDRLFLLDNHRSHEGLAAEPWPRTIRSRLLRYGIIEKVLPNLTAEHLKDPGYGDAIGLVRTDAKAKAALAIMAEFDKRLWEGGKMAQPIQIILMRRLAEYLSVPLFLVGPSGDLLFYNEPAEVLLGRRFDETGAMSAKEWSSAFTPEDSEGHPVPPEDVPLMITITKKRPAYQRFFIRGFDGVRRHVEVASIPIAGLDGDFLGGVALFWEVSD